MERVQSLKIQRTRTADSGKFAPRQDANVVRAWRARRPLLTALRRGGEQRRVESGQWVVTLNINSQERIVLDNDAFRALFRSCPDC